ncbi:unnamed protein product, partial [Symbiodinium sp. KB8]
QLRACAGAQGPDPLRILRHGRRRLCYCEKAGIRFLGAVPSKAVTTRVTTTSM